MARADGCRLAAPEASANGPDLEEADIYAALEYAAGAVQEREIPLVG